MLVFDLIALTLAADAILTAWFYGSIFESARKYFKKLEGLIAELTSCRLCFSYHPPFWLLLLYACSFFVESEVCKFLIKLPIYSLAVTDVVHFLQQIRPITEEAYVDDEDDETEV